MNEKLRRLSGWRALCFRAIVAVCFCSVFIMAQSGVIDKKDSRSKEMVDVAHEAMSGAYKIGDLSEELQNLQSGIIQNLQQNVDFLKENIVDFVNNEEILMEEFDLNGKMKKTTNILSEYRVFHDTAKSDTVHDCNFVYEAMKESTVQFIGIHREERKVLSVKENNKAQKTTKFTEPIWAKGHSYADLLVLFDKQYEKCFDYKLIGVEKIRERDTYAIEIKQKEAEFGESGRTAWEHLGYEGIAWVDAETKEVVRLNKGVVGIRHQLGDVTVRRDYFTAQYEYDKVKIRDQFLTLPVAKTVLLFREVDVQDGPKLTDLFRKPPASEIGWLLINKYIYGYSDYKTFDVSTKINYDVIDESLFEELPDVNEPD